MFDRSGQQMAILTTIWWWQKLGTVYLKDEINELATNSINKNIRDPYKRINEFKRV
jgi:hypothetical protein